MVDLAALNQIANYADKLASTCTQPHLLPILKNSSETYRKMASTLRRPYFVLMHLVAPDGIPENLPRALGFAVSHQTDPIPPTLGFQVAVPHNLEEIEVWRSAIQWLDTPGLFTKSIDKRFDRLRKMVDTDEATSFFRLPYPPKDGIPGVKFWGVVA